MSSVRRLEKPESPNQLPFQRAGMPTELSAEIERAIERLRPIASEALMTTFQQRMSAEVEAAFGEITLQRSEPER